MSWSRYRPWAHGLVALAMAGVLLGAVGCTTDETVWADVMTQALEAFLNSLLETV